MHVACCPACFDSSGCSFFIVICFYPLQHPAPGPPPHPLFFYWIRALVHLQVLLGCECQRRIERAACGPQRVGTGGGGGGGGARGREKVERDECMKVKNMWKMVKNMWKRVKNKWKRVKNMWKRVKNKES